MKKALTSAVVCVAMIASSVTSIAADTATSSSTPAAQTGPLSPGGPVGVSPAQGEDFYATLCGPNGDCTTLLIIVGVGGMAVALAAIMGAFNNSKTITTISTTGTGG